MASNVPYDAIAASKPFQILVGPEKKLFTMHSDLLARQSKPLSALVNGGMKEAEDAVVEWPEVDPETFIRFWQFAYTNDYAGAEPTPVLPPSPPAEKTGSAADSEPPYGEHLADLVNKMEELAAMEVLPDSTRSLKKKQRLTQPRATKAKEKRSEVMDHSGVFLSHARVYVLADYYDMPELMALSAKKLDQELDGFLDPCPSNWWKESRAVEDVVTALEYCYDNTIDKGGVQDELRRVLARRAARGVNQMWARPVFQNALERFGEMGRDILGETLNPS